jgi:hypothetical protein
VLARQEIDVMSPLQVLSLGVALSFATIPGASAQPSGPGGQPPCFNEFAPLRKEAEERAAVIRAGMEKKAERPELCQAFKNFAVAEEKVVKFVETNSVWCSVPPEAVKQMKVNHAKTIKTRNQVCNAALPAAGAPRAPSLSDALNTPRVPDASTTKSGRGTFDTLTGNPLTR